ncbi:uncharacterized protein N7482_010739 [Penicillium canariense]|uniref:Cytochrome P450 n=1 Tax=Penicillium canariense TaxID=189055 RepID=A0A9W9HL75_9EURO|nr:uncharacterized protein N7482_010739 [Penicillium canariense]KAJ5151487.1 hypothetical protein N7482_010739 [Penicillium canariense]
MPVQKFYLLGNPATSAKEIEIESNTDLDGLKHLIASHFAVVEPEGIAFQIEDTELAEVQDVISAQGLVSITIDGHAVRDPAGPKGLPVLGNYLEIYPDHLGNHQRLFEQYGPVIQTNNMEINKAHPLYALKTPSAGIFLGDTDTPEWRVAHKFLPPALGPKAGEAWNVYQYMLKLGSQAVGKLTPGLDFKHFVSPDAPVHDMVHLIAEMLSLNKKVTSKGDWYSSLPFGDPKRLKEVKGRIEGMVEQSIQNAARGGADDLPLQDAALKASNMVDYAIRATDNKGEKLPKESLVWALVVATAAGFTTTSSLLSWLIYGLVTYPGMQERLLQELIDNDFNDETQITADFTERLVFQDKYIKEMQRRHNPSFQPGRTAKTDLILPGSYRIPKDGVIIPAIHHIHNNPELWDNPYKFDPDRWDTPEVKNRHKAAYVPFGIGSRMCIGFNFALQEIKVFLPKLIYNYKFVREGDGPIEYDPMFQLIRPNNLYVRAHKRVKWPPKSEAAV